ncbi:VOC family protein [Streptomyces cahuitamycinicus]|uniref:VOC family protein n=1 Tax=Streptomyces cahuitamycinicus TaxID=2070367 RepID=A0A2N8TXU1_9ACTN|nr:VOC family protein [Streptomyces cahuitamycinicus]PNG23818.1 VOC family protein [Streptomyces cahuitamycinicus]
MTDVDGKQSDSAQHPAVPGWFDISSPDAARTATFYRGMFGWSIDALDDTYSMVSTGDDPPVGGIGQAGPKAPYTGFVAYFPVDDVDAALARAEKLGGTRVLEPQSTPDGRIAVFADPDGNNVGLLSP